MGGLGVGPVISVAGDGKTQARGLTWRRNSVGAPQVGERGTDPRNKTPGAQSGYKLQRDSGHGVVAAPMVTGGKN